MEIVYSCVIAVWHLRQVIPWISSQFPSLTSYFSVKHCALCFLQVLYIILFLLAGNEPESVIDVSLNIFFITFPYLFMAPDKSDKKKMFMGLYAIVNIFSSLHGLWIFLFSVAGFCECSETGITSFFSSCFVTIWMGNQASNQCYTGIKLLTWKHWRNIFAGYHYSNRGWNEIFFFFWAWEG